MKTFTIKNESAYRKRLQYDESVAMKTFSLQLTQEMKALTESVFTLAFGAPK
jgi:hypothetical protein